VDDEGLVKRAQSDDGQVVDLQNQAETSYYLDDFEVV
jgi:hypothetical protein